MKTESYNVSQMPKLLRGFRLLLASLSGKKINETKQTYFHLLDFFVCKNLVEFLLVYCPQFLLGFLGKYCHKDKESTLFESTCHLWQEYPPLSFSFLFIPSFP